jgi:hypothetical protein
MGSETFSRSSSTLLAKGQMGTVKYLKVSTFIIIMWVADISSGPEKYSHIFLELMNLLQLE